MAWIESHTVLIRHRKLLQLAVALSLEPVSVVGHLHALWYSVLEQQEDGDLTSWPDEMIAQAAAYKGDPHLFVAQLQDKKWMDDRKIHDWIDYVGLFLIKKYSTANPEKLKTIWKVHGYKYGKRDAKSLHRIANRKRTESEPKANLPNLTLPNLPNLKDKQIGKNDLSLPFGEFHKVFLTPEEHQTLLGKFGEEKTGRLIAELDQGIASKGYRYKSHYATLLNWERRKSQEDSKEEFKAGRWK